MTVDLTLTNLHPPRPYATCSHMHTGPSPPIDGAPMDVQIPMFVKHPLFSCGCKKFKVDTLGDHLSTCTSHSGTKKVHGLDGRSTW